MPTRVWILILSVATVAQADQSWPQFRGPKGTGQVVGQLPSQWNMDKNVAWKVDLPGYGWSSPVVHGDRVFISTAVADNQPKIASFTEGVRDLRSIIPNIGKAPNQEYRWELLCLDRKTGKTLWRHECVRRKPDIPTHPCNTYATESPATDGERVYAWFGPVGVVVGLTVEGKELWKKDLGSGPMSAGFGTGASPALADGRLFVQRDNEKKSLLVAFDGKTGEELWRVDRAGKSSWSTPLIWRNKVRTELIACGSGGVTSYDPATGKVLWKLGGMPATFTASPTADEERLYFGTSSPTTTGNLLAVNSGAEGDITLPKDETSSRYVVWSTSGTGPGMCSPVVHDGLLYFTPTGFLICRDAKTGEQIYRQRLPQVKTMAASPLVVAGKLLLLDEDGNAFIVATGPKYELLGKHKVEGLFWSTPAVAGNELFLRGSNCLYCIRE